MKFINKQIESLHDKYVEAIFQVARIEDKGITFPNTYEIINDLDKAEKEIPKRQIDIVLGIKRAYQYVIEIANSPEAITTRDLQNINKLINSYETGDLAGSWRTSTIGIRATKYIPPIKTSEEYVKLFSEVINKKYGFIDICKLCGLMTKLQPFNNGNKRTAICFCNALLVQKDIIPIQVIDYTSYIDKLINYYEDDDKINEYIQFLCKQSNYFGMIDSKLDGNYRNVFGLIKNNPLITKEQIAKILNISEATVSRSVACLKEMGYINGKTSNKSGEWIVKKLI